MEYLPNNITLTLPPEAFPLSTDSMVLAHFARLPKNARVLDLGSGCGTLGLLLCAGDPNCHVTGIELEEASHLGAAENISSNGFQLRMESICADLAQVPRLFPAGSFSVCISNPPYFSAGPASLSHPTARREDACPPQVLMRSAAWALKSGGDFFLVHKPDRMAQMIALAGREGMECKRLLLLRHREGGPVTLALMAFRKGARPGMILEEGALFTAGGEKTRLYRDIYHTEEE